jgi:undecaprenyl-diphosphatase
MLALAGAVVVIAILMVTTDARVAVLVKDAPEWLRNVFDEITDFGKSGWLLWPLGVALLAIAALASPALTQASRLVLAMTAVRLGFLFTAIAIPGLFSTVIKRLIGRARPLVRPDPDPFLYAPFVWRADHASLPSGHATTVFAAAVAFSLVCPRLRVPFALYAILICVTRVVLDAHYMSDVVAGAVVGTVGALLIRDWFAARRLGFSVDADGCVRTLPGPSFARIRRAVREAFTR